MMVCCAGDVAIAQLLTARMGVAALNIVDSNGKTALDYAKVGGRYKNKVAQLAPVAAASRARGGLTAAELEARA
jgi:hypothetical protein